MDSIQIDARSDPWLSVYIGFDGNLDYVLTKLIKPLTDKLLSENRISCFFFIRYFEAGPHIRLRLKGISGAPDEACRSLVVDAIKDFLRPYNHPSNGYRVVKYEPEIARYGGNDGMIVSERHFEDSSLTVLDILNQSPDWTYRDGLTVALILHTSFACCAGISRETAPDYFHFIEKCWVPSATRILRDSNGGEISQEDLLQSFESSYQSQRETFQVIVDQVWEAANTKSTFEFDWLNRWDSRSRAIAAELEDLTKDNRLTFPDYSAQIIGEHPLWTIYISYFHMLNNRLGIKNYDEGFLAFIIKRCLNR